MRLDQNPGQITPNPSDENHEVQGEKGNVSELPADMLKEIFSKLNDDHTTQSATLVSSQFNKLTVDQSKRDAANEISSSMEFLLESLNLISSEGEEKFAKITADISNLQNVQKKISNNQPVVLAFESLNTDNYANLKQSATDLPSKRSMKAISEEEAKELIHDLLEKYTKELKSIESDKTNLIDVKNKIGSLNSSSVVGSINLIELSRSSSKIQNELCLAVDHLGDKNIESLEKHLSNKSTKMLDGISHAQKGLAIERELKKELSSPGVTGKVATDPLEMNAIRLTVLNKYLAKGDYERALLVAEKIPEDAGYSKTKALRNISQELAKQGKIEEARQFERLIPLDNPAAVSSKGFDDLPGEEEEEKVTQKSPEDVDEDVDEKDIK